MGKNERTSKKKKKRAFTEIRKDGDLNQFENGEMKCALFVAFPKASLTSIPC